MGGEWATKTIEKIAAPEPRALAMGPFGSNIKTDNFVPSGVPVIRGQNLNADRFNDSGFVYLTEEKADELAASNAFPGDLVFTHRGTLGQVGIIPLNARYNRYVVSQSQMKMTCDKSKVDPLFLFYFFRAPQGQYELLSNTSTTGVPAISRPLSTLKLIKVPVPSLTEQRAIAHILGSLDDKIELNRRMNQTLEAMARAIFKSWFVDFDPVRAKVEGRPTGLPDDIDALFPDSFENSELGEIPKGWEVVPLPEIIDVNPARTLKKGQIAPYLEMKNMPENSARALDWYNRPFGSGVKFINGDTLMARITPCLENGKGAFVDFLKDGQVGWGSTEYIVFRAVKPLPLEYSYFLSRTRDLRSHAIVNMTGSSGRQRVPASIFDTYLVVKPNEQVAEYFGMISDPIMQKIKENDGESRTLTQIRETLLPKLIAGEVRISDAEKFLEEAV